MRVLLPTGRTPVGLYAALRDHAADGSLPADQVTVLGLGASPRAARSSPAGLTSAAAL
jgi:hypothetical protein